MISNNVLKLAADLLKVSRCIHKAACSRNFNSKLASNQQVSQYVTDLKTAYNKLSCCTVKARNPDTWVTNLDTFKSGLTSMPTMIQIACKPHHDLLVQITHII